MRQLSKEFIRDVQRVIGYDYIVGLIGLATSSVAGLMSAADKVKVDNLATTYAPIVHNHDDRYYTETEIDANFYDETEADALLALKLNSSVYTAADVLAKLVTVDGAGSGLDADLLDGNSSAYFLPASSYTAADVLAKLVTVDGAGSGLDADLLDGNSSAFYAPIASPTFTGIVTTAGQIAFPATANPSADVNTLDDYEEGTFTPTLTFATPGNLNVVYSIRTGFYTKIGRQVTATFNIATSTFTHTTASGALRITGLPFTALNVTDNHSFSSLIFQGITKASYTQFNGRVIENTALLDFIASGSGVSASTVSSSDTPTGGVVALRGTITYFV